MGLTDRARGERVRQAAAAAARYGESREDRRETERRQDAGIEFPDSPEALAARTARLLERQAVPPAMMVEAVRSEPLAAPDAFERILGASKELQAWSFLPRGARAARTVARISARENGRELPVGTGFLVSPCLLMTNHHVLPDAGTARSCVAEFDAQVTVDNTPQAPVRLEFDPDASSGLPGAYPDGQPLTRQTDDTTITSNRNTACPQASSGGYPRPTGYSCDEYPFASTHQGAASNRLLGRTFDWCQISTLTSRTGPGWSACMIPATENTAAGRDDLRIFYNENRVLENDAFYVWIVQ
ncbi:hypothetical protein ABTZ90_25140 [Streptomyces cellulosae]